MSVIQPHIGKADVGLFFTKRLQDLQLLLIYYFTIASGQKKQYNRIELNYLNLNLHLHLHLHLYEENMNQYLKDLKKIVAEYFTDELPENPYVEDARDVRCVSFSPNGDVLGVNAYERDIMEIIKNYTP